MQIRCAEAADEAALADIRRSAILGLAVAAMSMEQAETWAARAAPDRIARAIREHDVWVAALDAAAIGWVEVDRDHLAALYVSPSCARRGVGSALLARAETSMRNSGYATARLESSQNALEFYFRRGYRRWRPRCHWRMSVAQRSGRRCGRVNERRALLTARGMILAP